MTRSELDEIAGIGPKTKEILLKNFESVEKIREAATEELEKHVGHKKAMIIAGFFKKHL
jgi:excinuclease ABC subunit C